MPQSLSNILLHLIFSTKERYPFLAEPRIRCEMHEYIGGIHRERNCPTLIVGGTSNHIHILCRLARTVPVASLVQASKRSSTLWVVQKGNLLSKFQWQAGYGAFSIGQSQTEDVIAYIQHQEEHHSRISFEDEYREFLKKYEVQYDERYVWD